MAFWNPGAETVSVVLPRLWPWTQKVCPPVFVTPGKTIIPEPTAELLVEIVAMPGLAQITVMAAGLGGDWLRLIVVDICMLTPVVIRVAALMGGAVTVAAIVRFAVGVGALKPAGTPSVRLVVPAASGVKVAVALDELAGNVNAPETVPTVGAELVNGTVTVPMAGFSIA